MLDRVTTRGRDDKLRVNTTYQAIFTFQEPIVCSEDDVPANGGYFPLGSGLVEVTQLIGRFDSEKQRDEWMELQFEVNEGAT